jgi:hypothetical protein
VWTDGFLPDIMDFGAALPPESPHHVLTTVHDEAELEEKLKAFTKEQLVSFRQFFFFFFFLLPSFRRTK